MKIKEEEFQYDKFYNEIEWSLKITHLPTGLYEESGKKNIRNLHFRIKNELKMKLIKRILELDED